jgi:ElaB/YqjD/DUF883 family membrane-anchored ribosome-binding protein
MSATSPDYPFPQDGTAPARDAEDGIVVGAAARVAEAAASARDRLADATLQAQDRAEAFRDSAAGYIQCYPFRSVVVSGVLGFLVGLLVARLPR